MYTQEKKLALDFLNCNKNNEEIIKLVNRVSEMNNCLHSDRWSEVYDTLYANFKRGEISGAIATGLTYLIEEKGKELLS